MPEERLEESLKGYKEKISPVVKATLSWDRDLIFVGRTNEGYEIEFDAQERNPTPPRYYKSVELILNIAGKNLDHKKVERAISLSHEKYCSVYNSLRKDMDVKVKYILEEKETSKDMAREISD